LDITTSITLILVAAIGAIPSLINGRKIDNVRKDVNGKVDELMDAKKQGNIAQGRAEGIEQERGEERARQSEITIPQDER
jgi:hypothetical protein